MSKVEFKEFVKNNPQLINYVSSGETNWQKLYELYDLYGSSSNIWDKYLKTNINNNSSSTNNNLNSMGTTFKELVNLIKGVDLNTVQKGLTSLDKAIEAFKDIIPSKETNNVSYEPRPTYKYFED